MADDLSGFGFGAFIFSIVISICQRKQLSYGKHAVRRVFTANAIWEKEVGYCRAIRSGHIIAVTGCAPIDTDGNIYAVGHPYEQAKRCLEIALKAIEALDARKEDVVRTRMFVTDILQWKEFGRAHGAVFCHCPPATSMIEVKGLIDKDMMIEIEMDLVVHSSSFS